MVWDSCKKRRNRNRRALSAHHPTTGSATFWRNPVVVFVVTFAVLGSLRFHPRSNTANNANPKRNRLTIFFPKPRRPKQTIPIDSLMPPELPRITYQLVEEGKYQSTTPFRRYAAVLAASDSNPASLSEPGDPSSSKPALFSQWAEGLGLPVNALEFSEVLQRGTSPNPDPNEALFWETPPVRIDRPMEFVVMDAPGLQAFAGRGADQTPFASHFAACANAATSNADRVPPAGCVFDSLGKDAVLVAPLPPQRGETTNAAHLAAFAHTAPPDVQAAFWKLVGETWLRRVRQQHPDHPLWLSTSGLGVAYLHVRLDSRPKYYTYDPYKQVTPEEEHRPGGAANRNQRS